MSPVVLLTPLDAKRLATLRAEALLAGFGVTPSTDDHDRPVYIVSKWAMCRQCDSLDDLAAFLRRAGVQL